MRMENDHTGAYSNNNDERSGTENFRREVQFLSCGRKKGFSGGVCTCVKAGLKYSILCKFCSGVSFHNVAELKTAEEREDDVDNHVPIFQAESDNFYEPLRF